MIEKKTSAHSDSTPTTTRAAPKVPTRMRLTDLRPHPLQQAGRYYAAVDDAELKALAEDMQRHGQRQAVEVMLADNAAGLPAFTIIDGRSRATAARLLGWTEIDAVVREDLKDSDEAAIETAYLSANHNRRHQHPLDQARVAVRLFEIEKRRPRSRLTSTDEVQLRDRIGRIVHMNGRNLQRYLHVLEAPLAVQQLLRDGGIRLEHAAKIGMLAARNAEGQKRAEEIAVALSGCDGDRRQIDAMAKEMLGITRVPRRNTPFRAFGRAVEAMQGQFDAAPLDIAVASMPRLQGLAASLQRLMARAEKADARRQPAKPSWCKSPWP